MLAMASSSVSDVVNRRQLLSTGMSMLVFWLRMSIQQLVLLQEWPVICYNEFDGIDPRSSETGHE
jgi:hypothetical protein